MRPSSLRHNKTPCRTPLRASYVGRLTVSSSSSYGTKVKTSNLTAQSLSATRKYSTSASVDSAKKELHKINNGRNKKASTVTRNTTSTTSAPVPSPLSSRHRYLLSLSATMAREEMMRGQVKSTELVEASLAQANRMRHLNAFISMETEENLLKQANDADEKYANQLDSESSLLGIPVVVKDSFTTKNLPTTAASKALRSYRPVMESTVTERIKKAGGIILGKTNLDEFSMGSSNQNSYFGPSINPHSTFANPNDPHLVVSGGSSGGSAVAVASFISSTGIGGDTGGSVRLPASFCGIYGMKPSYGAVSRYGLISYASSLDCPSFFSRYVEDAFLLYQITRGNEERDSTSLPNKEILNSSHPTRLSLELPWQSYLPDKHPKKSSLKNSKNDLQGLVVGIPQEYMVSEMSGEVEESWKQAVQLMKDSGAKIKVISLPHTAYAVPCYYILATAEASSNLARYDGFRYGHRESGNTYEEILTKSRSNSFGPEVQRRILLGTFGLSRNMYESYYIQAQKIRRLISNDFKQAFKEVDVIVTPVSSQGAYNIDTTSPYFAQLSEKYPEILGKMRDITQRGKDRSSTEKILSEYMEDVFTIPASLAGLPAASLPTGFSTNQSGNRRPLSIQLITERLNDLLLFQLSYYLQHNYLPPNLFAPNNIFE